MPEWETKELSPDLLNVLEKPFTYLGKGTQSYVFLSSDEKYVLKLFRFDACKMPLGHIGLSQLKRAFGYPDKDPYIPFVKQVMKNFGSCKLAYDLAAEQTGLVFVHLNPKKSNLPLIHLKDRLGIPRTIDPSLYRFILQKKAEKFFHKIWENKTAYVQSYFQLLDELSAKGLVNLDPTIARNFGILDGKVVLIDVGNFVYKPEIAEQEKAHFKQALQQKITF